MQAAVRWGMRSRDSKKWVALNAAILLGYVSVNAGAMFMMMYVFLMFVFACQVRCTNKCSTL